MNDYENFHGDDYKSLVMNMQFEMYFYTNSYLFNLVKNRYLYSGFANLYIDCDSLDKMAEIVNVDHRLLQIIHDSLAAVFRFKVFNGELEKELFEITSEELISYYKFIFIDTLFLDKLDSDYWYLTKKWLDFAKSIIDNKNLLTRQIALVVLELNYYYNFDVDRQKTWEAAYKAEDMIKSFYPEIPWKI